MTTLFMKIYMDKDTPSPSMGEGRGEDDKLMIQFVPPPLPLIPSRQGRGNLACLKLGLRNQISITLLLIMVALSAGCAHRPDVPPSRQMGKPCDTCIKGVPNFAKVSDALWRGAQPTREGFQNLEAAGVKTIVNLQYVQDDLPLLSGTRLKYLWLPELPGIPDNQDLVVLLKVLDNPDNWPVFVHCKKGSDRVGYIVAAYRIIVQDWTADDAIHEMFDFHYVTIFFANPFFLRDLDKNDIRLRVKRAP